MAEDLSVEISEEIVVDEVAVEQEKPETIVTERRSEEIVLPTIKSVKQISGEKQKPEKKKKEKENAFLRKQKGKLARAIKVKNIQQKIIICG